MHYASLRQSATGGNTKTTGALFHTQSHPVIVCLAQGHSGGFMYCLSTRKIRLSALARHFNKVKVFKDKVVLSQSRIFAESRSFASKNLVFGLAALASTSLF